VSDDLVTAHAHCGSNRSEITASDVCGCFGCLQTFGSSRVDQWIDEPEASLVRNNRLIHNEPAREQTAICPYCGVDSVIGSASGFPITKDFLKRMNKRWLG